MTPVQHTVVSITLSGILYLIFKSWGLSIASLISGVLIDLDYVIDYVTQFSSPFSLKDFREQYYKDNFLRVRFLHAWELVFCLGITAWLTGWNPWVTGIWIGFGQHIFFDKINYSQSLLSYSFIWRWKKGFKSEKIFTKRSKEKIFRQ